MSAHRKSSREMDENSKSHSSMLQEFVKSGNNSEIHDGKELFSSEGFDMRPDLSKRFRTSSIQNVIGKVLHDTLYGLSYSRDEAEALSKTVANTIRKKLEGEVYERYKLVVHVVLGEKKGGGLKVGTRCLWDPETDSYASESFVNETIFCVATVYGLLFY